jgi:hypothetical protein
MMWFLGFEIAFDQGFWVLVRFRKAVTAAIGLILLGVNPKPILMGLCYSCVILGFMKTDGAANESWDPNADFSVNGGGLHQWLADLDINTVIDMDDEELKAAKERYENHS